MNGSRHSTDDVLYPTDRDDLATSNISDSLELGENGILRVPNDLDRLYGRRTTWLSQPTRRSTRLFHALPSQAIQRVLWSADANSFASLCLLNSRWHHEAQSPELYSYHLSRCPSYALSNSVLTRTHRQNELPRLKSRFAAEVRRNLFDAYLRPKETHINLISTCASSSAAFPAGEAFRFEFSPNGRRILAISSSRIYVLDATQEPLAVTRELKTVRRSLSASITDDGSLLAVLSSKYQANIYSLVPGKPVKHRQVIILDNPPRTIALAHRGTVLAAAYDGAIEVFSLSRTALATDRRSVRCEAVDSLTFSGDGSMIVGSSNDLQEPHAVVVTAPFYTENDPNITPQEIHSRMWTTQLLFPQISSTVSHAALLSGHGEADVCWLFAYDHTLMTYRAVRTDDTRTGVVYFLSPPGEERFDDLAPNVAPSVTGCGTLAVTGFERGGLFLYGIPDRLDVSPDMGPVVELHERRNRDYDASTMPTYHSREPLLTYSPFMSAESGGIDEDGLAGKVDWRQSLFVRCRPISSMQGYNTAKWVEKPEDRQCGFRGKRLIVTAPAGVNRLGEDLGDEDVPVDGSRLCVLDFEYGPTALGQSEVTIEVGDTEPELLTEQSGNMEVEVAMERRRTIRRNRTQHGTVIAQDRRVRGSPSSPISPVDIHTPLSASSGVDSLTAALNATQLPMSRARSVAGYHQARFPPRPPLSSSNTHNHRSSNMRPNGLRRGSQGSWETPPPPYAGGNVLQSATPPVPSFSARQSTPRFVSTSADMPESSALTVTASLVNNGGRNIDSPVGMIQELRRDLNTVPDSTRGESTVAALPNMCHNDTRYLHGATPAVSTSLTVASSSQINDVSSEGGTLGLRPNMIQPPSLPTLERQEFVPVHSATSASPVVRNDQNRLSLTGANLTNRLNHPTPPAPTEMMPQDIHGQLGNSIEITNDRYTDDVNGRTQQREMAIYQNVPSSPSTEQLDRLNRRSMQRWPVSVADHHTRSDSRDFAHRSGPAPPRGAWGAAGVDGAIPFNRAIATPDGTGLSRSRSRGSLRRPSSSDHGYASQTYYSTPNLVTQNVTSRPAYQRLDTIDSVNSIYPIEGAARSRSFDTRQMHGMDLADSNHQQYARSLAMTGRDTDPAINLDVSNDARTTKKTWRKREKNVSIEVREKRVFRCNVM